MTRGWSVAGIWRRRRWRTRGAAVERPGRGGTAGARVATPSWPRGSSGASARNTRIAGVHSLVGGALSLLLVFRTNTAYNRFWEGRQIFGRVATATRDAADFVGLYRGEVGAARADRVSALLKAFPVALQLHLQGFRFSPAHAAGDGVYQKPHAAAAAPPPTRLRASPACVGEAEVLRLFRRIGGDAHNATATIPLDAFLRALRTQPDVAAALGVPTDLEESAALDQLHLLKFDAARAPGAGVGLRELVAYVRRADRSPMDRGGAAGTAWKLRGDESRRRRGRGGRSRPAAAPGTTRRWASGAL